MKTDSRNGVTRVEAAFRPAATTTNAPATSRKRAAGVKPSSVFIALAAASFVVPFAALGVELPEIRAQVRSGDTSPSARVSMLRRPPHLLITTPESLYLMVTAGKSRETLRAVRNFRMGDFIRVAEHFGRVSERGLFHTEIQTENRDLTTLPNLFLVTHPVTTIRTSGTIVSTNCLRLAPSF